MSDDVEIRNKMEAVFVGKLRHLLIITLDNTTIIKEEGIGIRIGRLFPANDLASAFQGGKRDEATETSGFPLRSFFDQFTLVLCVVGEQFRSHGPFGSAPRRNVVIALGHRKRMVALNAVSFARWENGPNGG